MTMCRWYEHVPKILEKKRIAYCMESCFTCDNVLKVVKRRRKKRCNYSTKRKKKCAAKDKVKPKKQRLFSTFPHLFSSLPGTHNITIFLFFKGRHFRTIFMGNKEPQRKIFGGKGPKVLFSNVFQSFLPFLFVLPKNISY